MLMSGLESCCLADLALCLAKANRLLASYLRMNIQILSNIFPHMVHTLIFRSGFRVLHSVFMTAINYIKMTKKKQNVLLYTMSPKLFGFFWCCSCWSPTQTSCWAQMESVGGDRWCQVSNSKPQVCLVWIRDEHNMDGCGPKCKMERKQTLGCPTVLLSWWYKRIEGVLQLHNF